VLIPEGASGELEVARRVAPAQEAVVLAIVTGRV